MCGIVGYVGRRPAGDFLIEGLRRLEYRGYDSAGVAVHLPESPLAITKTAGRIDLLAKKIDASTLAAHTGIGHTRWATHGAATENNAHPHIGGDQVLAIVHNGVIENYRQLKEQLVSDGVEFQSATDSEVIAHLIASQLEKMPATDDNHSAGDSHSQLISAVFASVAQLRGTYGLVILFRDYPDLIIAVRLGSPLVVGVGDGEHFVASDASPLAGYAEKIVYLADHQMAVITPDSLRVTHRDVGHISHDVRALEIEKQSVALDGYPHYMLKEIFEQPESLRNAMRGRINDEEATTVFGGLNLESEQMRNVSRVLLTGCGTSWHAALVGEHLIEDLARVPTEVEYASELRYRNPPLEDNTLLLAITQSGETADTLAALREMKRKGLATRVICNVVGSTIAQEADGGIYLHAGPEIGVASTKAFTSQCLVLTMLALYLGRMRNLSHESGRRVIESLRELPSKVEQALDANDEIFRIASKYYQANNFLYLGRLHNFATALEGALKLKEISYIHAEGYPAAEMKHGPIALVDEHTPSVFVVPKGAVYEKVMANLEEIKARGGPVIAIVGMGDTQVSQIADEVIHVPEVEDYLQPIIASVPLQLLAYHIAVLRGCDVDKPRNLAKSVTVE